MKNTLKILGAALALCTVSAFAASALPAAEYAENAAEETQDTITETAQAFADDDIIASWEFDLLTPQHALNRPNARDMPQVPSNGTLIPKNLQAKR